MKFPPDWLSRKFAVTENRRASKIRGFHNTTQLLSKIRRNGVTVEQALGAHDELAFGIEDEEVSVVSCGELAFAFFASGERCWTFGHPTGDVGQCESAFAGFGVHQRKRDGETGDAAPGGLEISFGEALHLWRAWRMIRGYQVDRAIVERFPELVAVFAAADGRSALEECGAGRNCFGCEMQIVRAGLDSDWKAFGTRGAEFRKCAGGGEVHNVQAKFVFAAEGEEKADCGELGFFGARVEIGVVERPILVRKIFCGGLDRAGKFGVNQQWQPGARHVRQSCAQLLFGDHREAIDAGVNEETFESRRARVGERLDVARIAGDYSAPSQPVHAALAARGGALGFERGDVGRGRQAVQRHVYQKRVSSRGCGARGGCKTFPVGATGKVLQPPRAPQPREDTRFW